MKLLQFLSFIKNLHSFFFFTFTITVCILLYSGITNHVTYPSWIAFIAVLVAGLVLLINDWKSPLTSCAEKIAAADDSVADIFLPR